MIRVLFALVNCFSALVTVAKISKDAGRLLPNSSNEESLLEQILPLMMALNVVDGISKDVAVVVKSAARHLS
jgi:hypothetical protein